MLELLHGIVVHFILASTVIHMLHLTTKYLWNIPDGGFMKNDSSHRTLRLGT